MALIIIASLTGLLMFFTLLPISRYKGWWVRDFDFPRLQFFFFALLLCIASLLWLDWTSVFRWAIIIANILCMCYHAWWVRPYTIFHTKEVKPTTSSNTNSKVRIMVSNVLTPNRNSDKLLELVKKHDPDILVAVETDTWWQQQLDILEATHPHTLKCPMENLYGMHIYSRLQLKEPKIQFLVEDDIPSMHMLVVLPSGQEVRLHCLHPAPPSPTENEESTERDAELIVVAKKVAASKFPAIVTGDLNDVAWSPTTRLFRKISGLLDPRIGRGMFSTYHAKYPFFRWPLDHFFHSKHFTLVQISRLDAFGSDHFPILVELAFQPQEKDDQEGLHADAEDKARAKEDIAKEDVQKEDVHAPGE